MYRAIPRGDVRDTVTVLVTADQPIARFRVLVTTDLLGERWVAEFYHSNAQADFLQLVVQPFEGIQAAMGLLQSYHEPDRSKQEAGRRLNASIVDLLASKPCRKQRAAATCTACTKWHEEMGHAQSLVRVLAVGLGARPTDRSE
jgi:hypothetical protein